MNHVRRFFLVAILVIIVAGFAVAASLRGNMLYVELTDETMANYLISKTDLMAADIEMAELVAETGEVYTPMVKIVDASDLATKSSLIVRVTPTGNREAFRREILSEVTVLEVLQNKDGELIPDRILVFEPVMVVIGGNRIRFESPLNLMQMGREYVLCLNFFTKPEGYKKTVEESRMYLLSNPHFGIFALQDPITEIFVEEGISELTYQEIQSFDYLFSNEREREQYLQLRASFLASWLP